jgi:hypothetical protein
MKSYIKTLAILTALALATSVQAQLTSSESSSSAWIGTPSYSTGPAPTTGNGGTSNDNNNWASGSGYLGGYNSVGGLAQTFYLGTAGYLQNIQMVFTGGTQTFNIELFDLGTLASVTAALGSYPTTPTQMNFVPTSSSVSQVDMLTPGDQFTYTTGASSSDLTLTPSTVADAGVYLLANEVYAISVDPTGAAGAAANTWWVRGGTASVVGYQQGMGWGVDSSSYQWAYQDFEGKTGGTSGIRDFDTAVTVGPTEVVVPEPTSMMLMGLGVLAILIRRRHTA